MGLTIPENVFDAGLRINHFGYIIINANCQIGRWCDIHQGVNIGASNPEKRLKGKRDEPVIGDCVWIGPGAKIYGNISLKSQIQIGSNAVVNRSFGKNITIAGIPAKKISDKGTSTVDVQANINKARAFFAQNPKYKKFER